MLRRQALVPILAALAVIGAIAPDAARATGRPVGGAKRLGLAWQAYERGDCGAALAELRPGRSAQPVPPTLADYALWITGECSYYTGELAAAQVAFDALAKLGESPFAARARWRLADTLWQKGDLAAAATAYKKLVAAPGGDPALARFRLAERAAASGQTKAAAAGFREVALEHPSHPLADVALARATALGAPPLDARERIARAATLTRGRDWTMALAELALVPEGVSADVRRLRDFHLGNTLFKMRRQYARAGELLLSVWKDMGALSDYALFHGARGLSRGDRDDEAVVQYRELVRRFPRSEWAAEAQYLSGWLEFNRGRYREAIPGLEGVLARYGKSKFADDALWHLGFLHYLLGEHADALPLFARLAAHGGELQGGKGRYWHARALARLGRTDEAKREWATLVGTYPLTWYAILARARLAEAGAPIGPWGEPAAEAASRAAAAKQSGLPGVDPALAKDPLLLRVDALLAAGLHRAAAEELERGERPFIGRHKAPRALPVLFDRYRKAGDFHRPWALAESYGGRALRLPPDGPGRVYWEHAYPRAYEAWVEQYRPLGGAPPYYLFAIMYKESGFNPHDVSYADAIGLMQMIPPTTRRVTAALGIAFTEDLLYDPELNIKVAAWYVGRLLTKFGSQIPLGAGSYNGGPRPMMKWLDKHPELPMDELVELAAFTQTREYMKKVTAIYARYLMLYEGKDYAQPLTVDAAYLKNDLNY